MRQDVSEPFANSLSAAMKLPPYRMTPGLLSKLSGVPRATIVNWLNSRVAKPRNMDDVLKVADALRLGPLDTDRLLRAAGKSSNGRLRLAGSKSRGAASPATQGELPVRLTDLIGREAAVENILSVCSERSTRLITLVGTGGIGKTHLAVSAASRAAELFPDGIIWVPLAARGDSDELLPAIAAATGAQESNAAPVLRTIASALHGKRMLLLLDNMEQLVAGTSRLAELLETLPELVLLVTSRIALQIRGERVIRVHPLPTACAVELFLTRSAALGATFSLKEDVAAVAAICIKLEGLPLAIELAASWTRLLPPSALLQRLGHRLSILTNGFRDAIPRHRSLRATIAWSYDLLSAEQKSLFRRLAVLSGGVTFASARAVGGTATNAVDDALFLDLLTALVDHSLLDASTAPSEPDLRFGMLEALREFAFEMLAANDEVRDAHERHAQYFLALAESIDASFSTEPTAVWLSSLQREHENFRVALTWLFEDDTTSVEGARLVTCLCRYWFERGLFREARRWLERANNLPASGDRTLGARIALYLAFVANYEGDYATGSAFAAQALGAYSAMNDTAGSLQAQTALGIAALYTGDVLRAEEHFAQTLYVQREVGDKRGIAVALHNLGEVAAEYRIDQQLARERYEESLSLFREIGHTLNVASTFGALGELHENCGDIPAARDSALQAIAAYRELDNRPLIAEGLTRLARYELSAGNERLARECLGSAVQQLRMSFNPRHVADCFEGYASLALASRDFELGAICLGYSQQVRDDYHVPLLPASQRRQRVLVEATRAKLTTIFERLWRRGYQLRSNEAFEIVTRV